MATVSLLQCSEYENGLLNDIIRHSLENIGFNLKELSGKKVVVKPNLLMPSSEEKAIITHPEFFRSVVQIVKESGGTPILVESPAMHSLERTVKKTGYQKVVDEEGIEMADPGQTRVLHYEGAKKFKHLAVSEAYFDADIILSLPKFKTHGITYITGGVKLLFGAIPGMEKSKMHMRAPKPEDFAEFLLDLYGAMNYGFDPAKRIIHIMDAIMVQEGEGPGPSGKPRRMDAVLASENGIAMDCVAAKVAGLDIDKCPTIVGGFSRNYGISSPRDIQVVGDPIEALKIEGFVPATGASFFSNMFRWPFNTTAFKNLFLDRPLPQKERCTLCYQCKKICPAGAISTSSGRREVPDYNYDICIRCYCCLEICPEAAIEKGRGRFQWLLGG